MYDYHEASLSRYQAQVDEAADREYALYELLNDEGAIEGYALDFLESNTQPQLKLIPEFGFDYDDLIDRINDGGDDCDGDKLCRAIAQMEMMGKKPKVLSGLLKNKLLEAAKLTMIEYISKELGGE